ncbi:autotransport protein [Levilactobacillus parabrevis ATCC 53295]|uniref:Autotransport protein n=2 Tax=Levilactobacillus parabrevis TaxID=357278 RepID=A0A0R1H0X0_9LACO|nr:YhgE/Pip domain-containing protein [Levilactobacillus parabrevis]KRK36343.1 autotransport protein [Levilactobacillus parabrevis ATCC 53295]KRO05746.1 autotransport protein [Levilactobacillus parabrevis]
MIKGEWNYIRHNRLILISVLAIMFIPFLYSIFFLKSVWDPYGETGELPVAVVNQDKPVTYQGQKLNVGDQTITNLKKNKQLGWKFVSAKTAADGLKHHKYYTVITIPKNFSANAATALNKNPKKMTFTYKTNGSANYIAQVMSEVGSSKLDSEIRAKVTKAYAQATFKQIYAVGQGMDKAAKGSAKLKDGTVTLTDGLNTYTTGVHTLNNGLQQMKTSVKPLATGIQKLSTGSQTLQSGLAKYTSGVGQYANGVNQYTGGVSKLSAGMPQLTAGTSKLAGGASSLKSGTYKYVDGVYTLNSGVKTLGKGSTSLASGVTKLADGSKSLNSGLSTLSGKSSDLNSGAKTLSEQATTLSSNVAKLGAAADEVSAELAGLSTTLSGVGDITSQLNTLETGLDQFGKGISAIEGAANDIKNNPTSGSSVTGVSEAQSAADKAATTAAALQQAVTYNDTSKIKTLSDELVSETAATKTATGNISGGAGGSSSAIVKDTTIILTATSQMTAGLKQINDGLGSIKIPDTTGLGDKVASLQAFATGVHDLNAAVNPANGTSLTDGVNQLTSGVTQYTSGVDQAFAGSTTLNKGLSTLNSQVPTLTNGVAQIMNGTAKLAKNGASLKSGSNQVSAGATQLNGGLQTAAAGVNKLNANTGKLTAAGNKLTSSSAQLMNGSGQLTSGLNTLNSKVPTLTSGVNQLADGSGKLDGNSNKLMQGTKKLSDGSGTLAKSLKSGADQIQAQPLSSKTADMFAAPTNLKHESYSYVPNYGHALAPYVLSVALYVGALVFNFAFPIRKVSREGGTATGWFLSKVSIGAVEGLAMGLIEPALMMLGGLSVDHPGQMILISVFFAEASMFIVMFLSMLLDNPGRFIAMVLLMLQLGGSGGTFPMEVTNHFYNVVHPFLPMTYSILGFRQAITSGMSGMVGQALWVLALFTILGLALLWPTMVWLQKKHLMGISQLDDNQKLQAVEDPNTNAHS